MTATGEPLRTLAMGQDTAGSRRNVVEAPFGQALAALGAARPEIVGLTADLGKYTDIHPFRDAFGRTEPGRCRGRTGADGQGALRHHLWRLCHAAGL